jgi:pyridoxine 5-phosphate synthase
VIELHTGLYSDLHAEGRMAEAEAELAALRVGATLAHSLGLEVHAGHGLTFDNVAAIAAIPEIRELNIGHFLIGEAVFLGLGSAIEGMRARMDAARA